MLIVNTFLTQNVGIIESKIMSLFQIRFYKVWRELEQRFCTGSTRSGWCFLICLCKNVFITNLSSHTSHLYGRSPVCHLVCMRKDVFWVNPFEHRSHLNGRSPVCILLCSTKYLLTVNALPHISHTWFFSPVWMRTWSFRWCAELKSFLQ